MRSSNIYTTIRELPFRNFKIALIDKDLRCALIIDPNDSALTTDKELAEVWENIQEEFSIAIGGESINATIDGYWTLESLNSRVERLKDWLTMFLENPTAEFVELFSNEGFDYPTDDLKNYVQCIRNEIATLELRMDEKVKKLEAKEEDNIEPTHEHYADLMAEIRKLEGWPVPDTITTLDFCTYYKRLARHFDRLKREHGSRIPR